VLKDGLIVQDGTYDELLSQPGTFQQLVQGQALRH
jgi:ABC-type multidrug transport system fused ATPase/permease subunit